MAPTKGTPRMCVKCRHHNYMVSFKGHGQLCPFKGCLCEKCIQWDVKLKREAEKMAQRRKQLKQERKKAADGDVGLDKESIGQSGQDHATSPLPDLSPAFALDLTTHRVNLEHDYSNQQLQESPSPILTINLEPDVPGGGFSENLGMDFNFDLVNPATSTVTTAPCTTSIDQQHQQSQSSHQQMDADERIAKEIVDLIESKSQIKKRLSRLVNVISKDTRIIELVHQMLHERNMLPLSTDVTVPSDTNLTSQTEAMSAIPSNDNDAFHYEPQFAPTYFSTPTAPTTQQPIPFSSSATIDDNDLQNFLNAPPTTSNSTPLPSFATLANLVRPRYY